MSKTIIAAAMAFVLCFCAAHTHSAAVAVIEEINSQNSSVYPDVDENIWCYDAILTMHEKGIMTGMSDGTFAPLDCVTRSQFAVMLHRMAGLPEAASVSPFEDVAAGEWYADAVIWASQKGIITGYEDPGGSHTRFGPYDYITREQMAVMLFRYAVKERYDTTGRGLLTKFSDNSSVSEFASEAVKWAVASGIIRGAQNGTYLNPQGSTIRAESAAMLQRFLETFSGTEATDGFDSNQIIYKDILDRYYIAFSEKWGRLPLVTQLAGGEEIDLMTDAENRMSKVGYCFRDADGDGIPELLIGITEGNSLIEKQIYAMYTIRDQKTELVFESWPRSMKYYCDGDRIYLDGSGNGSEEKLLMKVDADSDAPEKLEVIEGVCWEMVNGAVKWLVSDDQWPFTGIQLTDTQAQERIEGYENSTVKLDYIPFAEYR